MQEILNMFKKNSSDKKFDHIKISLASPDLMRSWSYGEVKARNYQLQNFQARERWSILCKIFWTR